MAVSVSRPELDLSSVCVCVCSCVCVSVCVCGCVLRLSSASNFCHLYFVSNNISFDGSGHLAEVQSYLLQIFHLCGFSGHLDIIIIELHITSKFIPSEIYHLCWKPLHYLSSCVILERSTRGQPCRISMQQSESKQQILYKLLTSWLKLLCVILTLLPGGENKQLLHMW